MREKLEMRNYPTKILDKKIAQAQKNKRGAILRRKPKKKADDKIRLVFTHNKANPPLHIWIKGVQKSFIER